MRCVVLPALALGMLVSTAACGGAAHTTVPPLTAASTTSSPSVAPETAVEAAFAGYVKAIGKAVDQQSAEPLLSYATEGWANRVVAQYRANLWDKKKTIIGSSTVASATPAVTGATATLDACVDSSNAFEVPLGTKAVRAGKGVTSLGRWREKAELQLLDGSWKIAKITGGSQKC